LKNIARIIGRITTEERQITMSKEKQIEEKAIEEMARVIETTEQIARDAHCGLPSPTMYAKDLYWHGYRRHSEGEWIKHPASYECTSCKEKFFVEGYAEDYDPITDYDLHYCPNCGAKMKGSNDEKTD
jgi:DNA-directed RNA polymerase subunit RPC12/RpoP